MFLLSAGNEITEKNLRIFPIWGITEVDAQSVEKEDFMAEAVVKLDPLLLQEAPKKLRFFFVTQIGNILL